MNQMVLHPGLADVPVAGARRLVVVGEEAGHGRDRVPGPGQHVQHHGVGDEEL